MEKSDNLIKNEKFAFSGLKLKVCGMGDPDNILEVASVKPDYLGFIFYENSPRNFKGSIPELPAEIKKTAVFVNSTLDFIIAKIKEYQFSAVQLHGEETMEFCRELKENLFQQAKKVEIIKVFSVDENFDFSELTEYEEFVDFFLFDTKGRNRGGNGISFDWKVLYNYPSSTPFFLSGGIGPEQISEIKDFSKKLQALRKGDCLYGIDVNSKFEISPGFKNIKNLQFFRSEFATTN